jgi:hypothetical protein
VTADSIILKTYTILLLDASQRSATLGTNHNKASVAEAGPSENHGLAMGVPPRVTIVVASLETKNTGAAMKEFSGTLRTIIQGPGSSPAVAA